MRKFTFQYDTAKNSSYADSSSESSVGLHKGPNMLPSPKTAYLKSIMGKKGRAREYTEELVIFPVITPELVWIFLKLWYLKLIEKLAEKIQWRSVIPYP